MFAQSGYWFFDRKRNVPGPVNPSLFQSRYVGTSVTTPGSIIVASTQAKKKLRSGNLKYANPKATSALEIVTVPAASTPIQMLFQSHVPNAAW